MNREILGNIGQYPNVSKSNQFHVDFFRISWLIWSTFHRLLLNDQQLAYSLEFQLVISQTHSANVQVAVGSPHSQLRCIQKGHY